MTGPEPYWADDRVSLFLGDCLDVMAHMEADSVDAVVTDPPAGVAFMGREWDSNRGSRARWVEWLTERLEAATVCLKPGGHALIWSLPRTSHWTAWAIEDAGLEIRDCVTHLFGSGFPKSLDVSKAIDKLKRRGYVLAAIELGLEVPGNSLHDWTKAEHSPGDEWWERFKAHLSAEEWESLERAVVGHAVSGTTAGMQHLGPSGIKGGGYNVTAPATEDAARWEGWGTALKPGQEMWWLARKPIRGTVAANILEHGTGALNVDGCRVDASSGRPAQTNARSASGLTGTGGADTYGSFAVRGSIAIGETTEGRWPANIVLTHSAACASESKCAPDCPVGELDRQSGVVTAGGGAHGTTPASGTTGAGIGPGSIPMARTRNFDSYGDSGGASRFYPVFRYEPKAPASERPRLADGTAHETVKPLDLMRWLVRLITPPDGTVLDPFAGSGTTAEACIVEGFRCVLVEKHEPYAELIRARLEKPIQPVLFGGEVA